VYRNVIKIVSKCGLINNKMLKGNLPNIMKQQTGLVNCCWDFSAYIIQMHSVGKRSDTWDNFYAWHVRNSTPTKHIKSPLLVPLLKFFLNNNTIVIGI